MNQDSSVSEKTSTLPPLPYRIPVDVIVWIFLVLMSGVLGFAVFSVAHNPKGTPWYGWLILVLGLLFLLKTLLQPSGISAGEEGIEHQNFLLKTRRIAWPEIERVQTGTQDANIKGIQVKGTLGKVDPSMGPYLMVLHRRGNTAPFLINIKPYTRKGLANLVHIIQSRAPQAPLDEDTVKLGQGIPPSLFFPK